MCLRLYTLVYIHNAFSIVVINLRGYYAGQKVGAVGCVGWLQFVAVGCDALVACGLWVV